MDEALQRAWRRAQADPADREARRDYGLRLLRIGHRAAALHELRAADEEQALGQAREVDAGGARWTLDLVAGPVDRPAPPDREDARFPGALLRRGDLTLPWLLVPWPACERCQGEGAVRCEACGGGGVEAYDCPRCSLGFVDCEACGGSGLQVRPGVASRCSHLWEEEHVAGPWLPGRLEGQERAGLLRCRTCGLGGLTIPGEPLRAACGACGRFVCECPTP